MDQFDICIAGAGVIGLAIAQRLSCDPRFSDKSILLLEKENSFGQHTSSRNSEVIHAGIYYNKGSLKAQLCTEGKELLYQHCEKYAVPHKKIGKLIVAQSDELTQLETLHSKAMDNGVDDLEYIDSRKLKSLEAAISATAALLSPSTGIIDSHSYMQSLLRLSEDKGLVFAPRSTVKSVNVDCKGFVVNIEVDENTRKENYKFRSRLFINSGGLFAQDIASTIDGLEADTIPPLFFCKGDYFAYTAKNPLSHLVYPLPNANQSGLGIHATLDLSAQLRFGPDAEYVSSINYGIDTDKAREFVLAIKKYFPQIRIEDLSASYSGIRPKLVKKGDSASDFIIQSPQDHGTQGLFQLFGMESPALTSSLSIAEYLSKQVVDYQAG